MKDGAYRSCKYKTIVTTKRMDYEDSDIKSYANDSKGQRGHDYGKYHKPSPSIGVQIDWRGIPGGNSRVVGHGPRRLCRLRATTVVV